MIRKKIFLDYGLDDNDAIYELQYKDLGLQISWRTVFLIEYFGPILVHSIFYFFPSLFYSSYAKKHIFNKWHLD